MTFMVAAYLIIWLAVFAFSSTVRRQARNARSSLREQLDDRSAKQA
jgi:hypothetical protein